MLLLANTSTTLASIVTMPSKTNGTTFCTKLIKPIFNKDKAKKIIEKKAMITTTTVSSVAALQTAVTNSNVYQNTNHVVKFKNDTAAGMYIMKVTGTDNTMFTIKLIKN